MPELMENDILTKVSRYNLIRNQRLIYIDVHERMAGNLAGKFVAVPNLINIVARQEFQRCPAISASRMLYIKSSESSWAGTAALSAV